MQLTSRKKITRSQAMMSNSVPFKNTLIFLIPHQKILASLAVYTYLTPPKCALWWKFTAVNTVTLKTQFSAECKNLHLKLEISKVLWQSGLESLSTHSGDISVFLPLGKCCHCFLPKNLQQVFREERWNRVTAIVSSQERGAERQSMCNRQRGACTARVGSTHTR